MGPEYPSGMGADVECNFASFWASDWPEPLDALLEEVEERFRKSVARKYPLLSERGPWAYDLGHNEGTAEWIAFRDVCSPIYY